jgi:hypothetical protein
MTPPYEKFKRVPRASVDRPALVRAGVTILLATVMPCAAVAQSALPATVGTTGRLALIQIANEGVLDDAQVFKTETAATARNRIHAIRNEYHCTVFVDTVNRAPDNDWRKANSWSPRTRAEYFQGWAKARSQEFGTEGIHILICQHPKHVAVVVWPERFDTVLTPKERTGLERLLERNLTSKPDATLLSALDQVRADLQARREPEPPSVPLVPLGVFIGGAVATWLLLASLRWHLLKADPLTFTAQPERLRFTAGLLAGMFGSPCAYWITDRLFPESATGSTPEMEVADLPATEMQAAASGPALESPADERAPLPEHAEMKYD